MPPAELLINRLVPVDEAIARYRARLAGNPIGTDGRGVADPDVLAALEGLRQVVAELARQKWSA